MKVRLNEYRLRIKTLLAADDIEQTLVDEGVRLGLAHAVGISRAVVAQGSLGRPKVALDCHPAKSDKGDG